MVVASTTGMLDPSRLHRLRLRHQRHHLPLMVPANTKREAESNIACPTMAGCLMPQPLVRLLGECK